MWPLTYVGCLERRKIPSAGETNGLHPGGYHSVVASALSAHCSPSRLHSAICNVSSCYTICYKFLPTLVSIRMDKQLVKCPASATDNGNSGELFGSWLKLELTQEKWA